MTLTDIISKVTRYAKKIIVSDNTGSGNAITITTSATGGGIAINHADRGTLNLMPALNGEITFDGASDGVFAFRNISSSPTKATCFLDSNFGINTTFPEKTLHVNGTVRFQALPTYADNAAALTGGLVVHDVYKTSTGELRIVV
jgi:hypothetical protein